MVSRRRSRRTRTEAKEASQLRLSAQVLSPTALQTLVHKAPTWQTCIHLSFVNLNSKPRAKPVEQPPLVDSARLPRYPVPPLTVRTALLSGDRYNLTALWRRNNLPKSPRSSHADTKLVQAPHELARPPYVNMRARQDVGCWLILGGERMCAH